MTIFSLGSCDPKISIFALADVMESKGYATLCNFEENRRLLIAFVVTFYSSLEGAMKLKIALFCSS